MGPLAKPARVKAGDTVAIVSPSFGAVGRWPHRVERASGYLHSLGLNVRVMPNAGRSDSWASAPPEDRVQDLHAAFADHEITVVLTGIGGNHSNQLLPFLDFELMREHPKIFQGYSDTTMLHWALAKHAGLCTFHGPALVSELGEFPDVLPHTDRYLLAAWFGDDPILYEPSATWTDEMLDWDEKADLTRARELRESEGWVTIRSGTAQGAVLGGCLETICWHVKGSGAWMSPAGAILILETSEEASSPAHVDSHLTDLEQLGVFDEAAALIFGRPYGYTSEERQRLWEVIARRTDDAALPVLANVEVGHTDPMVTVPFGVPAEIDAQRKIFRLTEAPTLP